MLRDHVLHSPEADTHRPLALLSLIACALVAGALVSVATWALVNAFLDRFA
jgi:hypothetical protein